MLFFQGHFLSVYGDNDTKFYYSCCFFEHQRLAKSYSDARFQTPEAALNAAKIQALKEYCQRSKKSICLVDLNNQYKVIAQSEQHILIFGELWGVPSYYLDDQHYYRLQQTGVALIILQLQGVNGVEPSSVSQILVQIDDHQFALTEIERIKVIDDNNLGLNR